MSGLLLRAPVAHCCGEDEHHPLVLRDARFVGFPLEQWSHVAGDAQGLDGSLGLLSHGGDGSAYAGVGVLSYVPSSKRGSGAGNTLPPAQGNEVPMQSKRIATELSPAQRRMLVAAAKRYGKRTPEGNDAHFTHVGPGQASTARALEGMQLGGYDGEGRFWIWERGYEVAQALEARS